SKPASPLHREPDGDVEVLYAIAARRVVVAGVDRARVDRAVDALADRIDDLEVRGEGARGDVIVGAGAEELPGPVVVDPVARRPLHHVGGDRVARRLRRWHAA